MQSHSYATVDLSIIRSDNYFELWDCNSKPKIKFFYINETESLPIAGKQMKLSICPDYECPYYTFMSAIPKYLPN